jgi:CheY-like chemotaxis protein
VTATVLVCDNESILRRLVRATLGSGDVQVIEACDGDESLELARRHRPDLVILDVMMPGRTGLDVLGELRRDPDLADTRVIVLTARAQVADRDAALDAGADRFLAKPFSPSELAEVADELLGATR